MPKLWTKAQREYVYNRIAKAEGEQCLACYFELGKRRGPPRTKLEIDHADNDETNRSWSNLHLLCHKHNCKYRGQAHSDLFRSYSDQMGRERERGGESNWKTILRDEIPWDDGSAEMQARRKYEPRWERYAHQKISEMGSILRKDLIAGAAKFSGCAVNTSINYLLRHTGPEGPFKEDYDEDGNKIIVYLKKHPIGPAKERGK